MLIFIPFVLARINDDIKKIIPGDWFVEARHPHKTDLISQYKCYVDCLNESHFSGEIIGGSDYTSFKFQIHFGKYGEIYFNEAFDLNEIKVFLRKQFRFQVSASGSYNYFSYVLNVYESKRFELHLIDNRTNEWTVYHFVKNVKEQPWIIRNLSFICLGASIIFSQLVTQWVRNYYVPRKLLSEKRKLRTQRLKNKQD